MSELPRYLQLLWGREAEGRRGPRPGRSIHEIGAAAVEIADAEGLEAISMKRVAEAIGFTTMSLYRYVDSKDELLAVMADHAYGRPQLDYGRLGWRRRLRAWAWGVAERRVEHPWMVQLPRTAPPLTPNNLAWTEAGLAALAGTSLRPADKFSVLLAVDSWAEQHVRQCVQLGFVGRGDPHPDAIAYHERMAELASGDGFPQLLATSLAAAREDADTDGDGDYFEFEFERGLGLLLDGVDALMGGSAQ